MRRINRSKRGIDYLFVDLARGAALKGKEMASLRKTGTTKDADAEKRSPRERRSPLGVGQTILCVAVILAIAIFGTLWLRRSRVNADTEMHRSGLHAIFEPTVANTGSFRTGAGRYGLDTRGRILYGRG